jgi:hypothetical protein
MRYAKLLPMIAVALVAACMNDTTTGPDVARPNARITTTTTCQKEPGPDNTIESTSKNPAGKEPRGQQQEDQTLSNNDSNNCH